MYQNIIYADAFSLIGVDPGMFRIEFAVGKLDGGSFSRMEEVQVCVYIPESLAALLVRDINNAMTSVATKKKA